MGRAVVRPEVGLDLDDPARAATGGIVADEPGADQGTRGLERRAGQDAAIEDAQTDG